MSVTQREFTMAVMDPAAAVPEGLLSPDGSGAGRRFNVYRNNVAVSLTDALEAAFPALVKLLGERNFKGLAGLFLRQHPPKTPILALYGDEMPGFLERLPQVAHLPYLSDVARLELALRRAYHAKDAPVLLAESLAMDPVELMASRLRLHPATRIITSAFAVHDIWAYNMVEGAPKPSADAQSVLVTRPEFDPLRTVLPNGADIFLSALTDGLPFGAAVDTATDACPDFDLSVALASCLTAGAFTAIETHA